MLSPVVEPQFYNRILQACQHLQQKLFLQHCKSSCYTTRMKKTDQYYSSLLAYARSLCGSYRVVAEKLGASSGPQVEAWTRNGVAYKWRPILDDKFGLAFRKLSK
jgi:hypothetical protein